MHKSSVGGESDDDGDNMRKRRWCGRPSDKV